MTPLGSLIASTDDLADQLVLLRSLATSTGRTTDDAALVLEAARTLAAVAAEVEARTVGYVRRGCGATWATVADAYGVSRQAAQQRWSTT